MLKKNGRKYTEYTHLMQLLKNSRNPYSQLLLLLAHQEEESALHLNIISPHLALSALILPLQRLTLPVVCTWLLLIIR